MTKRRFTELLPYIHQTETLKKFFGATVDQLFQPGTPEQLSGYIGQKPSYYDPSRDFYVPEPTAQRQAYQLEPAMISSNGDGNITDIYFYDDLIDYLKSNRGNVADHNRLFSDEYYSWAPPLDIDKIINFQQYIWFGDSPDLIPQVTINAPFTTYIASGVDNSFLLPESLDFPVSRETPTVFVDGIQVDFDIDEARTTVTLLFTPAIGSKVEVFRYGDLTVMLNGLVNYDISDLNEDGVGELTSNMRVFLNDALSLYAGWDKLPFDNVFLEGDTVTAVPVPFDHEDRLRSFFVEGVGSSIELVWFHGTPVAQTVPVYVVIDRRSRDENPWTRVNYWVHRESLKWSGQVFPTRIANRPIVEFIPNIELFNYGTRRLPDVAATLTGNPRELPFPLDTLDNDVLVSDWYQRPYDTLPLESSGFAEIPVSDINDNLLGSIFVDAGYVLRFGDRLLILSNEDSDFNHRIVTVRKAITEKVRIEYVDNLPVEVPYTAEVMVLELGEAPRVGDMVRQTKRGHIPFDAPDGLDMDAFEFSNRPVEYYYDGVSWKVAQVRDPLDADPLFALFTHDGLSHAIIGEGFAGNRLFGFAPASSGTLDPYLDRIVRYDSFGQIVFENDMVSRATVIDGEPTRAFQFYKVKGETLADDRLHNGWAASGRVTTQAFTNGFYEVPSNLRANPDNDAVTFASRSEFFEHFTSILSQQVGFTGSPYRNNSWRDTARDLALGNRVIQNRSPLLKTMLLAADGNFDYFDAVRFVDLEYSRFRAKFVQQIADVLRTGQRTVEDTAQTWVYTILDNMRFAKTAEFPFALSTLAGGQYFIPPTPASLGLLPPTRPGIEYDTTYSPPVKMVRGHDGSRTPTLGEFPDTILLALEEAIYASVAGTFKTEASFEFDLWKLWPGRNRASGVGTPRYSRTELVRLLSPAFMRWAQANNYDFRVNTGYASDNPFTWNYRDLPDRDGVTMPGNWRAIYRFYFDTDRPNLAPWEMLGFAEQPTWWEVEYGSAPYTRGNMKLWEDLRDGKIAQGPRAGIDARFARPDLLSVLPVDEVGNLLDPIAANIILQPPSFQQATRPWLVGDGGPVENLFINSPSYRFALSQIAFLMRPAEWVETGWDTLRRADLRDGQWFNTLHGTRPRSADLYVHGEIGEDGATVRVTGLQQWISDMMVSKAQEPSALGNKVRGLDVRLSHKMAGFTQPENLRAFADNFGLVPGEDLEVVLHRSPPIRESTYSGLVIEWTGDGWSIFGYDRQEEFFKVVPGQEYGPRSVISLDDVPPIYEWKPGVYYPTSRLVDYEGTVFRCVSAHTSAQKFEDEFWNAEPSLSGHSRGRVSIMVASSGEVIEIPYYTIHRSYQEVADFISNYARWLEQEGWVFDGVDPDTGETQNWNAAIREFLKWAQMDWRPGNFIVLSPGASQLKFISPHGFVLNMEETANGIYGLIDRTGRPIARRDTFVSRLDEETKIICRTDNLFAARARVAEEEHVLLFANKSKFNDVIYDPLFDLRQPRLRLIGMRAQPWEGRHDARGYIIEGNNLRAGYEKVTANLRNMFEVERSDDRSFRDYSRHVIGYQTRSYLDNLLLSETSQFEFYQGMIQQKGAPGVFDKLSRSSFVEQGRDLRFAEEWALFRGRFGAVAKDQLVGFRLNRSDIRANPQLIEFGNDDGTDAVVGIVGDRWINTPRNPLAPFSPRSPRDPAPRRPLPSAGYARRDEITYVAFDFSLIGQLQDNLDLTGRYLRENDLLWIYNDDSGEWTVQKLTRIGGSTNYVGAIETSEEDATLFNATRIEFMQPHGLTEDDVDQIIVFPFTVQTDPDLRGTHRITFVESTTAIQISTIVASGVDYSENNGIATPPIYILRQRRFPTFAARDAYVATYGAATGDLFYIDQAFEGPRWGVYRRTTTGYTLVREQPERANNERLTDGLTYDTKTRVTAAALTPNPILLEEFTVFDPIDGLIPGNAEKELTYILGYDPGVYEGDQTGAWGSAQVGQLWWDTSTVRFIDPYTDILPSDDATRRQAEIDYRVQNWGRIAPGSVVDVYEWTRSVVPPSDYRDGIPINALQFLERDEFDAESGQIGTFYYFWVLNPQTTPALPSRAMSASQVAAIIENPRSLDLPWMAAIAPNMMLVSEIDEFLTTDSSVMQMMVLDHPGEGVVHTEWQIIRKDDERGQPPGDLWRKMRDSLVGFDDRTAPVPDPALPERERTGTLLRPRQSLFVSTDADPRGGMLAARQSFIEVINAIMARTPRLIDDASLVTNLTLTSPTYPSLIRTLKSGESNLPYPPINGWSDEANTLADRSRILQKRPYLLARGYIPFENQPFDFEPFDQDGTITFDPSLRILQRNDDGDPPSWTIWEIDPDAPSFPRDDDFLRVASQYNISVATHAGLAVLVAENAVDPFQRVLVESDETLDGFWGVYIYDPQNGFVLNETQTYRLSDFWATVDWFADGYSAMNPPIIAYSSVTDRDLGEGTDPQNTFVQVNDDGTGAWMWTVWNGTSWDPVARQNATVAFSDAFYDATRSVYLGTKAETALIPNRDGGWEMQALVDTLYRNVLSSAEINETFFSMLHLVHTQQERVEWAFKTSFLAVQGINERLYQTPVRFFDTTQSLLDYIDEVKPYRVKTRDFTRSLVPDIDVVPTKVMDFDKPLYFDASINAYRRLNPNDPADLDIITSTVPWSDWWAYPPGMATHDTFAYINPVRLFNMTLRFDRVDAGDIPAWRPNGWDVLAFDTIPFDPTSIDGVDIGSALARYLDYYAPGEGMVERNADTLFDLHFKGVQIDGGDLFVADGDATDWDIRPYDTEALETIIYAERDPDLDGDSFDGDSGNAINPTGTDYSLIDPYYEADRPEELAFTKSIDGLTMTVRSRFGLGAPDHHIAHTNTARLRRANTTISYDLVSYDTTGLLVYRDGIRGQENTDYTVDHFQRLVTVNLNASPRTKSVAVHVIGVGGLTAILDQHFFTGTGSNRFDLPAPPEGYADVVVDGVVVPQIDISYDGSTVVLANAPAVGSDVMIVERQFAGYFDVIDYDEAPFDDATSLLSTETRVRRETLVHNAQQEWTLTYPMSELNPQHVGTILEVDGLRYTPPFTTYGSFDLANREIPFFRVNDIDNVRVFFTGAVYDEPIGFIRIIGGDTFTTMSGDLAWDEGAFDEVILDAPFDIAVVEDEGVSTLVALDDALSVRRVTACLYEGHDYEVEAGVLRVLRPIGLSDLDNESWDEDEYDEFTVNVRIEATTFEKSALMGIETHVFEPNAEGLYAIPATIPSDTAALVWAGGRCLSLNVEYQFEEDPAWTPEQGQRTTFLTILGGQTQIEPVVVTLFTGDIAEEASTWGMVSAKQDLSMMGDPAMGGDFDFTDYDSVAYDMNAHLSGASPFGRRTLWRMNESFEYLNWNRPRLGSLAQDLHLDDEEIVITLNPYGVSADLLPETPLPLPDAERGKPGIIYIAGERIEYFRYERVGQTITLSELRRATRGTRLAAEDRVVNVYVADGLTTVFRLSNADAAKAVEVTIEEDNVLIGKRRDIDFTLAQDGADVLVTLPSAPLDGQTVILAQSDLLVHDAGSFVLPGDVTTFISPFQNTIAA